MMSMDHDRHNAVFAYVLWTANNALIFVVILLIYEAYHVTFYSVVETPALYIKSIVTVQL